MLLLASLLTVAATVVSPTADSAAAGPGEYECLPREGESLERWKLRCFGDVGGSGSGGERICLLTGTPFGDVPIACVDRTFGWWSNHYQCYMKVMEPQPPADDPEWVNRDGHPDDGLLYHAQCPFLEGVDGEHWYSNYHAGIRYVPFSDGLFGQIVE